MSEQALKPLWMIAALGLAVGVAVSFAWGLRAALGVGVGGIWNLASLWCLVQLLNAWLGQSPSKKRALGWLLVKFPCLYGLAFLLLWTRAVSPVGFGIGFTIVLLMMMGGMALRATSFALAPPHGR